MSSNLLLGFGEKPKKEEVGSNKVQKDITCNNQIMDIKVNMREI